MSTLLELATALELLDVEQPREGTLTGNSLAGEVTLSARGNAVEVRVSLEDLPGGFRMIEGAAARGEKDVVVGLPELDSAFVIQGANPAAVIRLLRSEGVANALVALQARASALRIEADALHATITADLDGRRAGREVLEAARLLAKASLSLVAKNRTQRAEAGHSPIKPLRDRSRELDAPPPRHPLHAREWERRKRLDRRVALGLGLPFAAFAVFGVLRFEKPTWLVAVLAVGLLGLTVAQFRILRCPACSQYLERPPLQKRGKPHLCRHCGVRLE